MQKIALQWSIYQINHFDKDRLIERDSDRLNEITKQAFDGRTDMPKQELIASINAATHIGLLQDLATADIYGFCLGSLCDLPLHGKSTYWINKVALSSETKSYGLGTHKLKHSITSQVKSEYPIGWIGFTTQNSALIHQYSTNIAKTTFPINSSYRSEEGLQVWTYILLNVPQVKERLQADKIDLDTKLKSAFGLLKNGYPKQLYQPKSEQELMYENALRQQFDFNPSEGDLLLIFCEL